MRSPACTLWPGSTQMRVTAACIGAAMTEGSSTSLAARWAARLAERERSGCWLREVGAPG